MEEVKQVDKPVTFPQVLMVNSIDKPKPQKINTDPKFLKSLPLKQQFLYATVNIPLPHWTTQDHFNFMRGQLNESNFQGDADEELTIEEIKD